MRTKEVDEAIKNFKSYHNLVYIHRPKDVTIENPQDFDKDIETVLSYISELEQENTNAKYQYDLGYKACEIEFTNKIRAKIKEIEENPNNPYQKVMASQIDASLISCLKGLLGGT